MALLTNIPVCILAGGASRRFGSPKGLAEIDGTSLIERVVDRIGQQTDGELVINAEKSGPYGKFDFPLVPDVLGSDLGPLAGVHAAMEWGAGRGFETVATTALDVPLLPGDLIARLSEEGAPAIASSMGRWHPVIGLWPCNLAVELADFIEGGKRSVHGWAKHCGAAPVEFAAQPGERDPFWNVNTQADLDGADLDGSELGGG